LSIDGIDTDINRPSASGRNRPLHLPGIDELVELPRVQWLK
jgi:hypothetical protein